MKVFNYINTKVLAAMIVVLAACTDDQVGPVLPDEADFVAPVWLSTATGGPTEFTEETAPNLYETFMWKNTDYGVKASVLYEVEVSTDNLFTDPKVLKTAAGSGSSDTRTLAVTVKEANDAMLALGLIAGQEVTVYLRVRSTVVGLGAAALYTGNIERTVTPYRSSDCGNFCNIGLIGAFTGWGDDVDMRLADPTGVDKYTWTVTTYITTGGAKFRADDSWDNNWGSAAFPSGTATAGGSDIAVPSSGYYKVTFNDATGEYTFVAAGTKTFGSIGVIGAQSSWGADIADLTQDVSDVHIWTGTIALDAGEVKFRADDAWADNWGETGFPSGYGTGGGPNVNIPVSATYFIYFNDATGEYFFGPTANAAPYDFLGIIGTATPGGWDSDTDFIQNPGNPYKWSKRMPITAGEAKFRADNAWAVNWGASTFPSGVGVQNGANVATQDGTYFITFNTLTGEYNFLK